MLGSPRLSPRCYGGPIAHPRSNHAVGTRIGTTSRRPSVPGLPVYARPTGLVARSCARPPSVAIDRRTDVPREARRPSAKGPSRHPRPSPRKGPYRSSAAARRHLHRVAERQRHPDPLAERVGVFRRRGRRHSYPRHRRHVLGLLSVGGVRHLRRQEPETPLVGTARAVAPERTLRPAVDRFGRRGLGVTSFFCLSSFGSTTAGRVLRRGPIQPSRFSVREGHVVRPRRFPVHRDRHDVRHRR